MERKLKERLVGAAALVVIVVAVVPELLTGPRSSSAPPPPAATSAQRTVTIDLAGGEHGDIVRPPDLPAASLPPVQAPEAPTVAPVGGPGASVAPAVNPGTNASTKPSAPVPVVTPPKVAATTGVVGASSPKAPAHPVKPADVKPSAKPPDAKFFAQIGVFSHRDHAEALGRALRGKGFAVTVLPVHVAGETRFRVRVGPEKDRARAVALVKRLQREAHQQATVVAEP